VATARGLAVWQDGRFRGLTPQDGLFEDAINCVLDDQRGGLWLSGDHGIYRLDQREITAFLRGELERISPAVFGVVDGLPSDETNGTRSHPAGCLTPSGELIFPTTAGLAVADLAALNQRRVAPLMAITRVRVGDTVVLGDHREEEADVVAFRARPAADGTTTIMVPAGAERLVEIHYTACSFALPTRTRFRYRLEGLETEWTEADTRRIAYYTDLRPGRYRFVVEACNSRGVWSESPALLALVHPPEVAELPAFRIAVAVLLIALGAGLYRLQQGIRLRLRLAEERSLVERERARIARDIHDDLGAKLTRVVFLSQLAENAVGGQPGLPPAQANLTEAALEAVQSLAEVVWATNPERDNLDSLVGFMCQQAEKFVGGSPVRLRLDVPRNLPRLPLGSDFRHHLFRVVKEALNNALKHAHARHIVLRLRLANEVVRLAVTDDGRGFRLEEVVNVGNGLLNMQSRVAALGGRLRILSRPGRGAWILVRVRLPDPTTRITAQPPDGKHP
jgi:signal transduction histidine kinase